MASTPFALTKAAARQIWIAAQGLDRYVPFGTGAPATQAAIEHLGYVQIDTINVIERCHHHILFNRIPDYHPAHLAAAQSDTKCIFEYWTHALSFVPTRDLAFFLPAMRKHRAQPLAWFNSVTDADARKVLNLIRTDGPLSIRDIEDDTLIEKDHAWGSRKPSKRALQRAFFNGELVVSARTGMLKTYELMKRHFGWERQSKPATQRQVVDYCLDRTLRAQGIVSLDSICHLEPKRKLATRSMIEARVARGTLVPVVLEGEAQAEHWAQPQVLETRPDLTDMPVHILSPFDPLIIQRKRLKLLFDYEHLFEAYVPKPKRIMGYFALPVLVGDAIVAAIDLKTDRQNRKLLVQQWTWVGKGAAEPHKAEIETALHRFERFQLQT